MENSTNAMQQDNNSTQTKENLTPSREPTDSKLSNSAKEATGSCQKGDHMESDQNDFERQNSYSDLTLDTLPSEIFLHMCSFLDARFVIHTLSKVCRSFHDLIMNDKFWKVRIAKRWPRKYPAIPGKSNLGIL